MKGYSGKGSIRAIKEYYYKSADSGWNIDLKRSTQGLGYAGMKHIFNNNRGQLVQDCNYTCKGELLVKNQYRYNERGKMAESYLLDYCLYPLRDKYIYNLEGYYIGSESFVNYNTLIGISLHFYDSNKRAIREEHYNPEGELKEMYLYKEDEQGNNIEMKRIKPDGSIIELIESIYDKQGCIKEKSFSSDQFIYKAITIYNAKGLESEEMIRFRSKKKTDCIYAYEYAYDSNDNWILRKKYVNGSLKDVVQRQIGYW